VLYDFCSLSNCVDGQLPGAGPLLRDSKGNLYGTTQFGGRYATACQQDTCGVVFKVDTAGKETMLHKFTGGADGWSPETGLVIDTAGGLYGTAGGNANCTPPYGCGVLFKITP
jgi:uncharacterized repeat protein (TIGR03803 family)